MKAEEIEKELRAYLDSDNDMFIARADQMTQIVLPLVRQAQREAYERAAQVVNDARQEPGYTDLRTLVARIRALMEKEDE